jgi:hypothetical protein
MTSEEYIKVLTNYTEGILKQNPDAKFAFIAPWTALANDPNNKCSSIAERDRFLEEYSSELAKFCGSRGYLYLDPNPYLKNIFKMESTSKYLLDHIHPGRLNGVDLYSRAVLAAG